jgi:hypothetical protein
LLIFRSKVLCHCLFGKFEDVYQPFLVRQPGGAVDALHEDNGHAWLEEVIVICGDELAHLVFESSKTKIIMATST